MNNFNPRKGLPRYLGILGAASLTLSLPAAPAHAAGDITNFNVKNCTQQRMFVCSFDKTDGSLKIPYKAGGVPAGGRKEFGCASLNKCKVIIGVSNKTTKKTLSAGMQGAVSAGSATLAVGAGVAGSAYLVGSSALAAEVAAITVYGGLAAGAAAADAAILAGVGAAGAAMAVLAVVAGASVAGLEIADGWSDGEVCNQVRRKAQKAGYKPKLFMKNGKKYQVIEQYATDGNDNFYVNPDGTAVITYGIEQGKGKCPEPLPTQLVSN